MKVASVCVAAVLAACGDTGVGTEAQTMSVQGGQGRVYYFDFGIQRITGLHESEMEVYGSRYCISRNDFEQSLLPASEQPLQYERLDVRAKVIFSNRAYFIDRAGVVSTGQGYVLLDKEKFVRNIKPASQGKC